MVSDVKDIGTGVVSGVTATGTNLVTDVKDG
jgi:hypothetical protein